MSYEADSQALDAEILAVIEAWHRTGERLEEPAFDALALRLFAYQLRYNEPYARYCARLGVTLSSLPPTWAGIPAVPAPAFKSAALATFAPDAAALIFETSGTTGGTGGKHYLETPALYDAALLAGFDRFMLADAPKLRYFNCVPNPADSPHSSLGYMMRRVAERRGDGRTGWYLRDGHLLDDEFVADLQAAIAQAQPVCIAATAFALVHLLDAMDRRGLRVALPPGSRIMETGGFKGRSRIVARAELYARACERFGLHSAAIVAEYGMTELSSQYYDAPDGRGSPENRRKLAPPWLRGRVVGPDRVRLTPGATGSIVHVDLANRASCIAIATEDLGVEVDEGLVLLGRTSDSPPRGCSLDAEDLRARSAAAAP
jgi:hypothetical protein